MLRTVCRVANDSLVVSAGAGSYLRLFGW